MRDQPVERFAVEGDAAGLVAQGAAQAVDESALAGAVRSDQPDPLALGNRQIDVLQRDKAAEPLAEAADRKQRPISGLRGVHAALCCGDPTRSPRARRRACTNPTMPLGAMITNRISSTPTINRLKVGGMSRSKKNPTEPSCCIVPSRIAPRIGPTQLVMPPITGIATLLTA